LIAFGNDGREDNPNSYVGLDILRHELLPVLKNVAPSRDAEPRQPGDVHFSIERNATSIVAFKKWSIG
jgi:hypothetical protein